MAVNSEIGFNKLTGLSRILILTETKKIIGTDISSLSYHTHLSASLSRNEQQKICGRLSIIEFIAESDNDCISDSEGSVFSGYHGRTLSSNFVSVQPMQQPTAQLFYADLMMDPASNKETKSEKKSKSTKTYGRINKKDKGRLIHGFVQPDSRRTLKPDRRDFKVELPIRRDMGRTYTEQPIERNPFLPKYGAAFYEIMDSTKTGPVQIPYCTNTYMRA